MLLKNSQYSQENTCAGPCRPSFTEHLSWLLQHFRGSKYFFSGESSIYCWPSQRFLLRTPSPSKIRLKPQKQQLELFCKKGVLRNFANFTGKHLCWSLFLIELQTFKPAALFKRDSNTDFSLILKTRFVLKIFKLLPWLFGHVKALRWLAVKIKLVFYRLILL